jgi:hypothetical protein
MKIMGSNISFYVVLTFVVLSSCRKKECDNPVPVIGFKEFIQYGDTAAKLIFSFKDCDGDIGLTQDEIDPPYDFNLFMEYFEKRQGVWHKRNLPFPFYYRIPDFSNEVASKMIEGEIAIDMKPYADLGSPYDTIKFEFMIKDKNLNESNWESTGEIIVP